MKKSKILVIDANIAQAAGTIPKNEVENNPNKRGSSACREVLDEIFEVGHSILLSPALNTEWDDHKSGYTARWLVAMTKRGRVQRRDVPENQQLREQITQHAETPEINAIMQKDVHLIETAQAADKIVLSMDDKVRRHFKIVSVKIQQLKEISWANPHPDRQEAVISWLQNGCEIEINRLLSSDS